MKRTGAVFLILITLSIVFAFPVQLTFASQSWPVMLQRGKDYELWRMDSRNFKWVSARPWVWDGSEYVPYIFEDHYGEAGYYLMRNAFISVRLYDYHAEIWNANYTEIRVYDEKWLPQYCDGVWHTLERLNPSFDVVTNSSGVFITQSWGLGYPIQADKALEVVYALREGRPMKDSVALTNKGTGIYEFRLLQIWDGIAANSIQNREEKTLVTSQISVHSLGLQFSSDNNDFIVFQDLIPTGYYDREHQYRNDVLQPTVISLGSNGLTATFTYSNRSLYTLGADKRLTLDPTKWTDRNEYGLSGYIQSDGYDWPPSPTSVGRSIIIGKQRVPWNQDPLLMDHYYWWRGYVSFLTGGEGRIPGGDIYVQNATLRMYLTFVYCITEWGTTGIGFWLDFYSGKNQWTQLTTDEWNACGTYEGGFVFIDPYMSTGRYYNHSVYPDSIARGNTQRTQFRFNMYADYSYPPGGYYEVQKCSFDNPWQWSGPNDPWNHPPILEVWYYV